MAIRILTFVGTGKYEKVTYCWQNKRVTTDLFPEAVAEIFQPDQMFVLVTGIAKSHENYRELEHRLSVNWEPVEIPEGKNESDLWTLLERCANLVNRGDELILDITHAFRSIPMMVFAVAGYLRATKKVTIRHIIYGAFEAGQGPPGSPKGLREVPVIDLTALLTLLDWLNGAELFQRRGDATVLGDYIKQVHGEAWRQQTADEFPQKLQQLGNVLQKFSEALHLAQVLEVMDYAEGGKKYLQSIQAEVERWAKPFAVILGSVCSEFEKLAHHQPHRLDKTNLSKQLALIEYYVRHKLYIQGMLLAREWLVSFVACKRGGGDWLNSGYRLEIEDALGKALRRRRGCGDDIPAWFTEKIGGQERDALIRLWSRVTTPRNTFAHCGMQKSEGSSGAREQEMKTIYQDLSALLEGTQGVTTCDESVVIDLQTLYEGTAKLEALKEYLEKARGLAGRGNEVVVTGEGPVWLYLSIAHELHGFAKRLYYESPVTGRVLVFDHSPD
ncbi:MAG: TIGR02221 family CRISPR-associated protein [bacterium JZ-2024 1]